MELLVRGRTLRGLRAKAHLTQEQLGRKGTLSLRQVKRLEQDGLHRVTILTAKYLTRRLGLRDLSELGDPIGRPSQPSAQPLVGREQDLRAIASHFSRAQRLVTLVSAPTAMGKTELARHYGWVNDGWPWTGGVWWCDLSRANSLDGMFSEIAATLGVSLKGPTSVVDTIGFALDSHGKCLLILDGFDPFVVHASSTLEVWLSRARHASFLVTSRQQLGLRAETCHTVRALSMDACISLLTQEALMVDAPVPSKAALRAIAHRVDCIPFALKILGAKLQMIQPGDLLARLKDPEQALRLSDGSSSTHSSLHTAFEFSWSLTAERDRSCLTRLSVFCAAASQNALEYVLGRGLESDLSVAQDEVQALLVANWLEVVASPYGETAPRFLRMLKTVREYVKRKAHTVSATEIGETANDRVEGEKFHGRWFARFGERATLEGLLDSELGLMQLESQLPDSIAACQRAARCGDVSVAVPAFLAADGVLAARGPIDRGVTLAEEILSALPERTFEHAIVANRLGTMLLRAGDFVRARDVYQIATDFHMRDGASSAGYQNDHRLHEAALRNNLGYLSFLTGELALAREHYLETLAIYEKLPYASGEVGVLNLLGLLYRETSEPREARRCFQGALDIALTGKLRRMSGVALHHLGVMELECGDWLKSFEHFDSALAIARSLGNRAQEAAILTDRGVANSERNVRSARQDFEVALKLERMMGMRPREAMVLREFGNLEATQGRLDRAECLLLEARTIYRELGSKSNEALVLSYLGSLEGKRGNVEKALELTDQSLDLLREFGPEQWKGLLLAAKGEILRLAGRASDARDALLRAGEQLGRLGYRVELAKVQCQQALIAIECSEPELAMVYLAQAEQSQTDANAIENLSLSAMIDEAGRGLEGVRKRSGSPG